jgi:iron complex outermembrane recepter protein
MGPLGEDYNMKLYQNSVRARLLPSLMAASSLAMIVSTSALAQEAAASEDDSGSSEEILVIGTTKQATNIQDVPTAITVFSGEQLAERSVGNVKDVGTQTPGFLIRSAPSNSSAIVLGLRGQVQNDVLATVDPSVGTYVDGIYWARAYGLNSDILDVRNVQILKGPQGTLFGRNTSSGALVIESNDPDIDDFGGSIEGRYGTFNSRGGTAVLNVPLIPGRVAVRGAFTINKRDGYVLGYDPTLPQVNGLFPLTGEKFNNRDIVQGRAKLLIRATDDIDLTLSGEIYHSKEKGPARFLSHFSTALGPAGPAEAVYDLAHLDRVSVTPGLDGITPGTANGTTQNLYSDPFSDTKTQTYSARLKFDLGAADFQFTNAYRKVVSASVFDLDGTALQRGNNDFNIQIEQYSSELQLSGRAFSDKLDYVIGGTYLSEKGFDDSQGTSYPGGLTTPPLQKVSNFRSNIKNDALGIYAQGGFHFTDQLTLTAGVRHSWDTRKNISDNQVPLNAFAPVPVTSATYCLVNFATPPANGNCFLAAKDSYQAWSYTAGLDYKITDDILIYAKTGKGYRAGAQQLRVVSLATSVASKPETNIEQEIGFKSQFMDNRVRFNVAGYYNEVKDWQTTKILTTSTGVRYTAVLNPADLRNYGVEADLSIEPVDGLVLGGSLALNNEKYKNCLNNLCPEFVRDVVQKQFNLNASYSGDLGFAKLGLNVNYAWTGGVPLSADRYKVTDISIALFGTANVVTPGAPGYSAAAAGQLGALAISDAEWDAIFRRKSAGILDARASLTFADSFEIYAFGKNLTDQRYIEHTQFLFNLTTSSQRNDPRTYGVGVKYSF